MLSQAEARHVKAQNRGTAEADSTSWSVGSDPPTGPCLAEMGQRSVKAPRELAAAEVVQAVPLLRGPPWLPSATQ